MKVLEETVVYNFVQHILAMADRRKAGKIEAMKDTPCHPVCRFCGNQQ